MAARPVLRDGAPGPGDSAVYPSFDEHLLPLVAELREGTVESFMRAALDRCDAHPWTAARWLWSARARHLLEPHDEVFATFRVRPQDASARLAELRR